MALTRVALGSGLGHSCHGEGQSGTVQKHFLAETRICGKAYSQRAPGAAGAELVRHKAHVSRSDENVAT